MFFLAVMLLVPAFGGRKRKSDPVPVPVPVVAPEPLDDTPWFPGLLFPVGPLPAGIANPTAGGCAACHPVAYRAWQGSGHGGPPPQAILDATEDEPACTGCHLPLAEQRERTGTFGFGATRAPGVPQPFSASLWTEGVTCAACHVRDSTVLGPKVAADGPHPVRGSATLGGAEGCATCHELTVDGAPWYDTFSSWSASPYAEAGIACRDCHPPHGQTTGPGVSLLVDMPTRHLSRGGEALAIDVMVQNTGAGHTWPSTGPYSGAEVVARLVGPPGDAGEPQEASVFVAPLARPLGPDGRPAADTRIPPMGTANFPVQLSLPQDAVAGLWRLEVVVRRGADATPTASVVLPLVVD